MTRVLADAIQPILDAYKSNLTVGIRGIDGSQLYLYSPDGIPYVIFYTNLHTLTDESVKLAKEIVKTYFYIKSYTFGKQVLGRWEPVNGFIIVTSGDYTLKFPPNREVSDIVIESSTATLSLSDYTTIHSNFNDMFKEELEFASLLWKLHTLITKLKQIQGNLHEHCT